MSKQAEAPFEEISVYSSISVKCIEWVSKLVCNRFREVVPTDGCSRNRRPGRPTTALASSRKAYSCRRSRVVCGSLCNHRQQHQNPACVFLDRCSLPPSVPQSLGEIASSENGVSGQRWQNRLHVKMMSAEHSRSYFFLIWKS